MFKASLILIFIFCFTSCSSGIEPFSVAGVDKTVSGSSEYPLPVDIDKVGLYPGKTKSGGGMFYDDILEYRVWCHPEKGAKDMAEGEDYYFAFSEFEVAKMFSNENEGTEEPLVLIRQIEWINEPTPGVYLHEKGDRITEWRVEWLQGSKRGSESIRDFIGASGH